MSERNYWVLCDDNCRFPAMTREQILAAIAEATGNAVSGCDDAFITKIREMNANANLKFWLGTMAQFNALDEKDGNTLYIFTDDDTADSIENKFKEFDARMSGDEKNIQSNATKIDEIHTNAKTLNVNNVASDDYRLVTYSDDLIVHEIVYAGLYMIRVENVSVGTLTHCSFMFDFSGSQDQFSCAFKYDNGKDVSDAVVKAEAQGGGEFILKVVSTPTATEENEQFNISVRRIGSNYAVG